MRQESGNKLRVTIISSGFEQDEILQSVNDPELKAEIAASMDGFRIPPDAIAHGRRDSVRKKSSFFPPRDSIDHCGVAGAARFARQRVGERSSVDAGIKRQQFRRYCSRRGHLRTLLDS